jgi:hypothetical protein
MLVVAVIVRRVAIMGGIAKEGACLKETRRRFLAMKEKHFDVYSDILRDATDILSELDKAGILK